MKKIITINILVSIVFIFLSEILINYLGLAQLGGVEAKKLYDLKSKDFKYKANATGLVFNKIVYTDENGFRVPVPNYKYDNNKNSIIFFGDSVTFGNGVSETDSFVGLFRDKFKEFNFYNVSTPGNQTNNHYKNFIYLNKIKNIKKVFYIFTLNDIDVNTNTEDLNLRKNENFVEKLRSIKLIDYLNVSLRDKSYLYIYLKGILTDPSARWFKYDYNLYNKQDLIQNLEKFIKNFNNKVLASKNELSVIILPYEYQTREGQCRGKNLMPQNQLIRILKDENIKFYNLTTLFCSQKNPKDLFYKFDPMHLSESGHNLTFKFLLNEVFN